MIQTYEQARRLRRHQQQSYCPAIPISCSTPRIVISVVSLLCVIVSLAGIIIITPAAGKSTCPSRSGDWLPGYDAFGAAVSVCVATLAMALFGFASVVSSRIDTLIGARARARALAARPRAARPVSYTHLTLPTKRLV